MQFHALNVSLYTQTFFVLVAVSIGFLIGLIYIQSARQATVDVRTGFVHYSLNSTYRVRALVHAFSNSYSRKILN